MALLEAHGIGVRFGELQAVRDVDLEVDPGGIVGLIGPNGAGKTTTFNAISGVQTCTGRVVLDGHDVSRAPVHRRAWLGLHRTFQRLEVFGSMTAFDNVRTAGATFDARYAELSTRADLIVYNGHAGLGSNVRALASKGRWTAGQYAIVFMNGCDTFAYVDSALWDAHARVNPDDPTGTKHLDIVMNAMPAYFSSMPAATMAMVRGLMAFDAPRNYEQLFANIRKARDAMPIAEWERRARAAFRIGEGH